VHFEECKINQIEMWGVVLGLKLAWSLGTNKVVFFNVMDVMLIICAIIYSTKLEKLYLMVLN